MAVQEVQLNECKNANKIRTLSSELSKIAREHLNEIPERIEQDVRILHSWIKQQRHLRARDSDVQLIVFLRRCKYY